MTTTARKASLVAWSALFVAAAAFTGCSVVNSPGSGTGGSTGTGANGATGAGGNGATGAGGNGATGAGGSGATGAGGSGANGGSGGAEPCTTQEQCAPGYCDSSGVCQARKALGTVCSQAYECTSGFCVDACAAATRAPAHADAATIPPRSVPARRCPRASRDRRIARPMCVAARCSRVPRAARARATAPTASTASPPRAWLVAAVARRSSRRPGPFRASSCPIASPP